MTEDNSIVNLMDLDKIYKIINPIHVDKVESFS